MLHFAKSFVSHQDGLVDHLANETKIKHELAAGEI